MTQATGSQSVFALFEETTFNTDPGTPDGQKLYLTNFGLAKSQNRIDSETLVGGRGTSEPFLGNVNVSGPISTEISAQSIGTIMKHAIGSNVTTGADPYTHTMTIGDLPTSLLFEVDYGPNISGSGRYIKYGGCRIASTDFEFPQEGACTATFNIIGAQATPASSPLDATLTDNGHTTFSAFSAAILEGGGSIAVVKQVSFTVDNQLDESSYVIGSGGVRTALPEGTARINGSLTAIFADATLMNKALGDTESSLQITLTRGDGLGSAGNESISFEVQQLKYEPTTPSVDGPRGVEITLPFIGYLSGSDLGVEVIVKNAVATV